MGRFDALMNDKQNKNTFKNSGKKDKYIKEQNKQKSKTQVAVKRHSKSSIMTIEEFPAIGKTVKIQENTSKTTEWCDAVSNKIKTKNTSEEELPPGWIKLGDELNIEKNDIKYDINFIKKNDARIALYEKENEIKYPYNNYIYEWEYDDEKKHEMWLDKLDDYGSDIESVSETESEYDSDEF